MTWKIHFPRFCNKINFTSTLIYCVLMNGFAFLSVYAIFDEAHKRLQNIMFLVLTWHAASRAPHWTIAVLSIMRDSPFADSSGSPRSRADRRCPGWDQRLARAAEGWRHAGDSADRPSECSDKHSGREIKKNRWKLSVTHDIHLEQLTSL